MTSNSTLQEDTCTRSTLEAGVSHVQTNKGSMICWSIVQADVGCGLYIFVGCGDSKVIVVVGHNDKCLSNSFSIGTNTTCDEDYVGKVVGSDWVCVVSRGCFDIWSCSGSWCRLLFNRVIVLILDSKEGTVKKNSSNHVTCSLDTWIHVLTMLQIGLRLQVNCTITH